MANGLFLTVSLAALASMADAQDSTMTASGSVATHVIAVGQGNYKFDPDTVTASIGDVVRFEFYTNHSAMRMAYDSPCVPYERVTPGGQGGWWSGFMPMQESLDPAIWDLTVTTLEPMAFYCSAPGSCMDYQMVGIINPNASTPISALKSDAALQSFSLAYPDEPWPAEGIITPGPGSSTAVIIHNFVFSPEAIAGVAVGALATLTLFGLLFFFVRKKKSATLPTDVTVAQEAGLMTVFDHPPMYDQQYSITSSVSRG